MTRQEKNEIVDCLLFRYRDVGRLIVSDDVILCRLLATLEIGADEKVGQYLCSFLIA